MTRWKFVLVCSVVMFLVPTALAFASGASFGIRPSNYDPARPETKSYFVYDVAAGQVFQDEVLVSNSGDERGTAALYPVDAQTSIYGGIVFPVSDYQPESVGTWISLQETEITLDPGETQTIPFEIRVPDNVQSGHHVGGLVVENLASTNQTANDESNFHVKLVSRAATAVQVNVAGETTEQLHINDVRPAVESGYQKLLLDMHNAGNVMVKSTGVLRVLTIDGEEIRRQEFSVDTLLPDATIAYPLTVADTALDVGEYSVVVDLTYGTDNALSATYNGTFEITPQQIEAIVSERTEQKVPEFASKQATTDWQLYALIAGVGLVGIGVGVFVARRSPRQSEETA